MAQDNQKRDGQGGNQGQRRDWQDRNQQDQATRQGWNSGRSDAQPDQGRARREDQSQNVDEVEDVDEDHDDATA